MSRVRLAVVSASLDWSRTEEFWSSWRRRAEGAYQTFLVQPNPLKPMEWGEHKNGFTRVVTDGICGVVPAFAAGVKAAAAAGYDIIACFHDDLRIDEEGWDLKVLKLFEEKPRCGLAGFFGAKALGAGDIYQTNYSPIQLARGNCGSNMEDAERHGERWTEPTRVVCHDGFSLIGRAGLMKMAWPEMEALGIKHHIYDVLLGAMSMEAGWENWFLPIRCMHKGGMTAVGSEAYQEWAKTVSKKGDLGLWEEAHRIGYERMRRVLPLYIAE